MIKRSRVGSKNVNLSSPLGRNTRLGKGNGSSTIARNRTTGKLSMPGYRTGRGRNFSDVENLGEEARDIVDMDYAQPAIDQVEQDANYVEQVANQMIDDTQSFDEEEPSSADIMFSRKLRERARRRAQEQAFSQRRQAEVAKKREDFSLRTARAKARQFSDYEEQPMYDTVPATYDEAVETVAEVLEDVIVEAVMSDPELIVEVLENFSARNLTNIRAKLLNRQRNFSKTQRSSRPAQSARPARPSQPRRPHLPAEQRFSGRTPAPKASAKGYSSYLDKFSPAK